MSLHDAGGFSLRMLSALGGRGARECGWLRFDDDPAPLREIASWRNEQRSVAVRVSQWRTARPPPAEELPCCRHDMSIPGVAGLDAAAFSASAQREVPHDRSFPKRVYLA